MSLVQQWANVIGLCAGFYGVLCLTKEWPFIFGRRFRSLVHLAGARNVNIAKKIQIKYQDACAAREKNKNRIYVWLYDITIYFIRLRSRNEARFMKNSAYSFEGKDIDITDRNGILDPEAVRIFSSSLHGFVDDLVENGEARDLSVQGLTWVLASFVLQIFGNLPLPW